jgi:hypothetical protein
MIAQTKHNYYFFANVYPLNNIPKIVFLSVEKSLKLSHGNLILFFLSAVRIYKRNSVLYMRCEIEHIKGPVSVVSTSELVAVELSGRFIIKEGASAVGLAYL